MKAKVHPITVGIWIALFGQEYAALLACSPRFF
jgi:hypothetical protein